MYTNPQKLIDKLEKLPSEIYEQEKKVIEAKEKLESKKIELDVKFSQAMLESQRPNASEKKAEAIIKTEEIKREVLKANIELERATAYLTAQQNHFTSLRKISNIEQELMRINVA